MEASLARGKNQKLGLIFLYYKKIRVASLATQLLFLNPLAERKKIKGAKT